MKKQMRAGFTMIELIFVIVILGILAAIALPKFIGVSQQAHEANLKSFTSTLNGTTGPTLWSKSLSEGKGGKISEYSSEYDGTNFSKLIDIPKELDSSTIKLENCGSGGSFGSDPFAESNDSITGAHYKIYCRDGNTTSAPAWKFEDNDGNCLAGACNG
jgi:prepilin-type N-terminal cleavage/methylation domain-containing protein